MHQLTSPTRSKWASYNRWRSKNRKLDQQRRLEKAAAKKQVYIDGYEVPKVAAIRKRAALATVIIRLRTGERHQFAIHDGAFGLTVSPTVAGKRVALVIANLVKKET